MIASPRISVAKTKTCCRHGIYRQRCTTTCALFAWMPGTFVYGLLSEGVALTWAGCLAS